MSLTIQSIPSKRPSPVLALHGIILNYHIYTPNVYFINPLILRSVLFNLHPWLLQYPNILLFTYLLQKINKVAPINFSYFNN